VFIPGGGWRSFDPMIGLAVSGDHIAVVATSNPEFSLPVTGTVRGKATSELATQVTIKKIKS